MLGFFFYISVFVLMLLAEIKLNTNKIYHEGHTCALEETKNYKDFLFCLHTLFVKTCIICFAAFLNIINTVKTLHLYALTNHKDRQFII